MERLKSLNRYQKAILLFMTGMVLVFAVLYSVTIKRIGFDYKDTILVPSKEEGTTTYSGKIKGEQVVFTVSEDKTILFQYGDKLYGPYTAKEDPTAIPKDDVMIESLTGIVLYQGEEIIFRGGASKLGDFYWLVNADGSSANINIWATTSNGNVLVNGNIVENFDPMEPSIETILDVMNNPSLTHKGDWLAWFMGVFICFITAVTILFADELFRFNLAFQIRDADNAEPSDWEITSRYISWTVLSILALITFIVGLEVI